jgi:hypothetical protein
LLQGTARRFDLDQRQLDQDQCRSAPGQLGNGYDCETTMPKITRDTVDRGLGKLANGRKRH